MPLPSVQHTAKQEIELCDMGCFITTGIFMSGKAIALKCFACHTVVKGTRPQAGKKVPVDPNSAKEIEGKTKATSKAW